MADINAKMIKELRTRTNAGVLDCREALQEADGDMEKAVDFLRKKGLATALKRAGRETTEGVINSYIHAGGKIGVLVEVNCETDFVAKTDEFAEFVKNIAMQIAATRPLGIGREDVDEAIVKLGKTDPRNAELVKLLYFAGLSLDQVAKIEGVSRRTATRWWTYARAWLHREISNGRDFF